MPIQTIYCDESGFTGEHLLNREQRFFGYATVAIEPEEAADLVSRVMRDYRLQGHELKGRNLLRNAMGRQAVTHILDTVGSRSKILVHHKEFALTGKFFEYTFEPLISDNNVLFYSIDFHLFIANMLFLSISAQQGRAAELMMRFEEAVRSDGEQFRALISLHAPHDEDPIEQMISFCVYNRHSIMKELQSVKSFGGWILELTMTSVWGLLGHWGERAESLRVFCDDSKPLRQTQGTVNMMVGRSEKAYVSFRKRRQPLTFNLSEPIHLSDSRSTPGIQIADVLAATGCACFEKPDDEWCHKVGRQLFMAGALAEGSIFPDPDYINVDSLAAKVNYLILLELVERSSKGESLLRGMPEFVAGAYQDYPEFERRQRDERLIIEPE